MTPQSHERGSSAYISATTHLKEESKPDVMRIVSIDGLDENPCCGTHVPHLGLIQGVKFVGSESTRGATRVWFVAGGRMHQLFSQMLEQEVSLTKLLKCAPSEQPARVAQLVENQKSLQKQQRSLQLELAESLSKQLVEECKQSTTSVVSYHREGEALPFLMAITSEIAKKKGEGVYLLTGGSQKGDGVFVLKGPTTFINEHANNVVEIIGGRGGGRNGLFQGRASRLECTNELVTQLEHKFCVHSD